MESSKIIALLASSAVVETICRNIAGTTDTDLQDLAQDIYLDLLQKDNKLLNDLWTTNTYTFYITKMVLNNVFSKTSPYYETYKRFKRQNDEGYIQDNREILTDN